MLFVEPRPPHTIKHIYWFEKRPEEKFGLELMWWKRDKPHLKNLKYLSVFRYPKQYVDIDDPLWIAGEKLHE